MRLLGCVLLVLTLGCGDDSKPNVTPNDDGTITIDRLDPGESVLVELKDGKLVPVDEP